LGAYRRQIPDLLFVTQKLKIGRAFSLRAAMQPNKLAITILPQVQWSYNVSNTMFFVLDNQIYLQDDVLDRHRTS
jgi:hypothetical protein